MMRILSLTLMAAASLMLPACGQETQAEDIAPSLKFDVANDSGAQIGTLKMVETPKGVLMTLDLTQMGAEGERAVHFHEKGDCSPLKGEIEGKGAFTNSGGHYNPKGHDHGFHMARGAHAGDMPNLIVHAGGVVKVKILNTFVTLLPQETDGRAPLFDTDGSALVIHAGADDYVSQPSGAAGSRYACAELTAEHAADAAHDHAGGHAHGHNHAH